MFQPATTRNHHPEDAMKKLATRSTTKPSDGLDLTRIISHRRKLAQDCLTKAGGKPKRALIEFLKIDYLMSASFTEDAAAKTADEMAQHVIDYFGDKLRG